MDHKILSASARLADSLALDALVEPIPDGHELRAMLRPGFAGRTQAYDQETRTARYIGADGKTVVCFTLTNITLQQAAEVAAELDDVAEWSLEAFRSAAERAIGGPSVAVQ